MLRGAPKRGAPGSQRPRPGAGAEGGPRSPGPSVRSRRALPACRGRRPRPPPGPAPLPPAPPRTRPRPAPAHLALADAEDSAAVAQAHAGVLGPRGCAAEGERATRGAQPLHRGAHERGRPATPAHPQVQVTQRDEHGRPAGRSGTRARDTCTDSPDPTPPAGLRLPPDRGPEEAEPRGESARSWGGPRGKGVCVRGRRQAEPGVGSRGQGDNGEKGCRAGGAEWEGPGRSCLGECDGGRREAVGEMIDRLGTGLVNPGVLPGLFKPESGLPSLTGRRQTEEEAVYVYYIN